MSRTLFNISDDLRALDHLISEVGGDISDPSIADAVEAWIRELDSDLTRKADNYAALIAEMRQRAEIRKAEAERLAQKARRDEDSASFLSARLMAALEERGLKKIETDRFTLSVAANGGKAPLSITEDVPLEWCRTIEKIEPDKEKIRTALEGGADLPFASLLPRGKRLSIK
jgi:hypothetical protein